MTEMSRVAGDGSLIPGVVQDTKTGRVLMVGYLNQEAIDLSLETGYVHFWSRSRQKLWKKGETSGNTLRLVDIAEDCDGDALLIRALPDGPTCHTGDTSCFDASRDSRVAGRESVLDELWSTIELRKVHRPEGSYTVRLLNGGVDLAGRKVLEEAGEVLMAAKDHAVGSANDLKVAEESADLLYHLLVLLSERNVPFADVIQVLKERSH